MECCDKAMLFVMQSAIMFTKILCVAMPGMSTKTVGCYMRIPPKQEKSITPTYNKQYLLVSLDCMVPNCKPYTWHTIS